jgi:hypothetical protein
VTQGVLATLGLEPTSLLEDRLRVALPRSVELRSRRVGGLMGMEISPRREQQAWIVVPAPWGASRVALLADDPFVAAKAPAPALADEQVAATAEALGVPCRARVVSPRCLLVLPTDMRQRRNDLVAGLALVTPPDGTWLTINVITDRATVEGEGSELAAFVERVGATIEPGARSLDLGPRLEPLGPVAPTPLLRLQLPGGFATDTDRGADFVVHTIARVHPGADPFVVKLYLGQHPSRQATPRPGQRVDQRGGHFLGQPVSWIALAEADGIFQELVAPVPGADVYLHVFATTFNDADAASVRNLVAALTTR